jgi:hypothetical protein
MRTIFKGRSTVLTVLAAAVLIVVAGGGGAVAGGLVTSARIKNNTIQSVDVKNNALTGTDIKNESIGGADVQNYSLTNQDINVFYASVEPDGTLAASSGGVTSTRSGTGLYAVRFGGRNISTCAWTATPTTPSGIFPPEGAIGTADLLGKPDGVFLSTRNNANTATDVGFHLVVVC